MNVKDIKLSPEQLVVLLHTSGVTQPTVPAKAHPVPSAAATIASLMTTTAAAAIGYAGNAM